MKRCLVVIVTHNSQKHIEWLIDGLENSALDLHIRIVDSGSSDCSYLKSIQSKHPIEIILKNNIGFVSANNLAIFDIEYFDWVLYLNPDARIEGESLDKLISIGEKRSAEGYGLFSLPLVRFDIENKRSLSVYDSHGISCSPLGRWHDVNSGRPIRTQPPDKIDAVCGALMLMTSSALIAAKNSEGKFGFEPKLVMYKEDIELSLRVQKCGFKIFMDYSDFAYHCRGWSGARRSVPKWARWLSAKNDIFLARNYIIRALPYSVLKFLWVAIVENCRESPPREFNPASEE